MKNQILTSILLPTKDKSELVLFKNKELLILKPAIDRCSADINQHLCLCSTLPIKEGQYGYDKISNTILGKCDGFENIVGGKCAHFQDGNLVGLERILVIEFTTDPKLIADGVPAIDGNTMVFIEEYNLKFGGQPIEVNFLSEYCKRYNQKDNQKGVDVEKIIDSVFEKLGGDNAAYHSTLYTNELVKALQSNAGGFSLEDMKEKCKNYVGYPKLVIDEFIKSLTKEQPKGDIIIECELETVIDSGAYPDGEPFKQRIKLDSKGQPILTFK